MMNMACLGCGTPSLVLQFEYPSYYVFAGLIILFMLMGPFVPFMLGWRLGERVPIRGVKVICLGFLIIVSLFLSAIPTFGGWLLYIFWTPHVSIFRMGGAAWFIIWLVGFSLGLSYLLLKYDRYLVRRRGRQNPDESDLSDNP